MKYTPTRPLEYVCIFPADFDTKNGEMYLFLVQDVYSEFIFPMIIDKDREPATILKNITALMNEPNFCEQKQNGFTLVLHKYNEILTQANDIVKPHNGKVIVDEQYVADVLSPTLEQLVKHMAKTLK